MLSFEILFLFLVKTHKKLHDFCRAACKNKQKTERLNQSENNLKWS